MSAKSLSVVTTYLSECVESVTYGRETMTDILKRTKYEPTAHPNPQFTEKQEGAG